MLLKQITEKVEKHMFEKLGIGLTSQHINKVNEQMSHIKLLTFISNNN